MQIRNPLLRAHLCFFALLALTIQVAQASHFRGGTLTWRKLPSPANTIELTITEVWRTGALSQISYTWGDGTAVPNTTWQTLAQNPDYTIRRRTAVKTYGHAGPFTIAGGSCCRLSSFINAANGNYRLSAVVDLANNNQGSPTITTPVILQFVKGGVNTVALAVADVDGDTVSLRFATPAESGIGSIPTGGGHTLQLSPSGVLSWNTSGTSVGQLYAVQVIASDNHVGGVTRVPFDFVIQIVDGDLNRPPVASGNAGPFIASIGQPFSTVITGTDPDGGSLVVSHQGLPSGGTLTPSSGTSAPSPLAATFNWTPTLAHAGSSFGVTIVFTDPGGLEASHSFAISVPANAPPIANAGADSVVFDLDESGLPTTVQLDGSASSDPENVPLTYSWTQTSGPLVALSGATTATPSFVAPRLPQGQNGDATPVTLTFTLVVSDGNSSRSDEVSITVKRSNRAPTAIVAYSSEADENTLITLDGSGSSDPDGDSLVYIWTQISGPAVTIPENHSNNPRGTFSLSLPGSHCLEPAVVEFTLTVSDGVASSTSGPFQIAIFPVNEAPTVSAGQDQNLCETVGTIALAGIASDADGDEITSYAWTQIAGTPVALQNANTANASFSAPHVSAEQGSVTLTFRLVVSDACSTKDVLALSAGSVVNVTVTHANQPPVADPGGDQTVPEGAQVALDATGSYDPDGGTIADYYWHQISGPAVDLTHTPHDPVLRFVAPDVGPDGADLTFQLIVVDNVNNGYCGVPLASEPKFVTVFVQYQNRPPTIVAEPASPSEEGATVSLEAAAQDPDGNPLTYSWVQTGGAFVTLSGADTSSPTFTAPLVPCDGDELVFEVTVSDGFGGSASAAVTVPVYNINNAPVADAGSNVNVPEGTEVMLNAAASADPDGEALTFSWTQIAGPAVPLNSENTARPTFAAPMVNQGGDPSASMSLAFEVTVLDSCGGSAIDIVEVIVSNVAHAPIARAGGSQTVSENSVVYLNGAGSSDPDGDELTYSWTQIGGPAVALHNPNSPLPAFVAPWVSAGGDTVVLELTVTDPYGESNTDTATIAVLNSNNPPDCSRAVASTTSLWPPNHSMIAVSINGISDPDNNAAITINAVRQDEPINGLGDGDTGPDAIIQGSSVLLRAERGGKGNGRVYHISYTAIDPEGSCSGVVKVVVPHDRRGGAAGDGGPLFDSLGN